MATEYWARTHGDLGELLSTITSEAKDHEAEFGHEPKLIKIECVNDTWIAILSARDES